MFIQLFYFFSSLIFHYSRLHLSTRKRLLDRWRINQVSGSYVFFEIKQTTILPLSPPLRYRGMDKNSSNNGSFQDPLYPLYYDPAYRIVGTITVAFFFAVGFVGNSMVVLVVSRTSNMKTPTNCYLVSLAVADCLALLSTAVPYLFEFHLIRYKWLFGEAGCRLFVYVQYLSTTASILSITAFTVERYLAVCQPIKAQKLCTMRRAKKIIFIAWIIAVAYNSPWLGLVSVRLKEVRTGLKVEHCNFYLSNRKIYLVMFMCDLVLFYAVPLLLTCLLYTLIAKVLLGESSKIGRRANVWRRTMGSSYRRSHNSRVQVS